MNQKHFDTLKAAAAACVSTIDELTGPYTAAEAADAVYTEDVRKQRAAARNADTARQMTAAVDKAKATAAAELEAMRKEFTSYMGQLSNPTALKVAEALVKTDPTPGEVMALASSTTDYITLKVLQPYSKGRIKLPDAAALEHDLGDVKVFFDMLKGYAGPQNELKACTGPDRPFGLNASTAATIVRGQVRDFAAKMDAMSAKWENVKED